MKTAERYAEQLGWLGKRYELENLKDGGTNTVPHWTVSAGELLLTQKTRITELEDDLQFVERWAVHHGTKSHITPAEALSMIQHYPAITNITKGYVDGKVPDTFNPYARIAELEAQLADAQKWQPIETAPKNGQCLLWVETDDGGEVIKLLRDARGNWLYEGEPTFCASFYIKPTHWMPLPKPPVVQPKEQL